MNTERFVFRKSDKVGVADARMDKNVLLHNFIETGDYSTIRDFARPERFILGRAGVGKTALITRLQEEHENVILVEPESLSLGYISNSTIIQNLSEIGVDFALFYRMLWRHVLVVEILKYHFGILDDETQITILERLRSTFSQNKQTRGHTKALAYMEKWGSKFWQETNHRIREIKETIESDLRGEIGAGFASMSTGISSNSKLTNEQKSEVVHKAQEVVNSVQMKELSDMMKMLDDAIDDRQKQYYLVIDRLDEDWVDENIRYELIMALIETVKDFAMVHQVKPMIVLRNDLLSKVYDRTRRAGFQEEKFATLSLHVSWTKPQMAEMLDKRIDYLIKSRYTKQAVTHKDILPKTIKGEMAIDYMINRTLMRPRDLIDYFNHCIEQAVDAPSLTEEMVLRAERDYSRARRSAVRDEWFSEYPNLNRWDILLDSLNSEFFSDDIDLQQLEKIALEIQHIDQDSQLHDAHVNYLDGKLGASDFRTALMIAFYNVGYIGVELSDGINYWVYETRKTLHREELRDDTIYKIHPTFYSCFNARGVK